MSDLAPVLLELTAATLGECGGSRMSNRIAAVWPGAAVAAPAFTARCTPGDNLGIHVAVATAPAGSVLVAEVGDEAELGYWGEVLTTAAEARGLAGLVIDGCVRDVDALEAHRFPVFSSGIALTGASKNRPGAVGGTVNVGGVDVTTGDWVVADRDGVVVIADVDRAIAEGRTRHQREAELFEALAGGATTLELLGLDRSLITGP